MNTQWNKYKGFLALGLIFIFGGACLLIAFFSRTTGMTYIIFPIVLLLVGVFVLYQSLTGKRQTLFLFSGLLLNCTAFLFLLTGAEIIPYKMSEVWPIVVMLSGIILIVLRLIRNKSLSLSHTVAGLFLIGAGFVFMLFSLNIITISFVEFASKWWPTIFILFGLVLIALFIYMQKIDKNKVSQSLSDDEDIS
ncbi:MAG: DUF5668 domain-containing protein [Spirochaetales bacterium]